MFSTTVWLVFCKKTPSCCSLHTMITVKQWYFLVCCIMIFTFVVIHLNQEICRLDQARQDLESKLALLPFIESPRRYRRTPAQFLEDERTEQSVRPSAVHRDLVIYNRVPKTGSTSFAGLTYDLCRNNKFSVLHLNTSSHVLSLPEQERFVDNITQWTARQPALYHGHLAYVEFSRFGLSRRPIYINIVREPIERMVSYYYFTRYGDDLRPDLKRKNAGNTETFDDCMAVDGPDCSPKNLWLQVPYFCGHHAECWQPGSKWALEQAKDNLVNNFLVVGLTEELEDFISILEVVLPRFFRGASEVFRTGPKSHLRKTYKKVYPSAASLAQLKETQVWQMENEFYEFAKKHFQFIKKRTFSHVGGKLVKKGQQFMYEKIQPKSRVL